LRRTKILDSVAGVPHRFVMKMPSAHILFPLTRRAAMRRA
jgi:hypothetical protein